MGSQQPQGTDTKRRQEQVVRVGGSVAIPRSHLGARSPHHVITKVESPGKKK